MQFSQFWPEIPFPASSIQSSFNNLHERHTSLYPSWSISASRRKLAVEFWLKILLDHFAVLLGLSLIINLAISQYDLAVTLRSAFPASVLVFLSLFLTMYWPFYHFEFLPHLDACVENYRQQQLEGIQQCKKQQYSVLSLMLIQHVFQDLTGIKRLSLNTGSAQMLARQYGVSVKSILPVLQLIYRADWDRKSIRKRTEITDDFETAREYFLQLEESRGIVLLDKLQQKILQ